MKCNEIKKYMSNLQVFQSKLVVQALLDTYEVDGIKKEYDNIAVLSSKKQDEYNIVCSYDDKFYVLHGKKGKYTYLEKQEITEKLETNVDSEDSKDNYTTEVNVTGYKDSLEGVTIEKAKYCEDKSSDGEFVFTKTDHDKYKVSYDSLNNELPGLGLHLYDYEMAEDPILRDWSVNIFVNFFLKKDLDYDLKKLYEKELENQLDTRKVK